MLAHSHGRPCFGLKPMRDFVEKEKIDFTHTRVVHTIQMRA